MAFDTCSQIYLRVEGFAIVAVLIFTVYICFLLVTEFVLHGRLPRDGEEEIGSIC